MPLASRREQQVITRRCHPMIMAATTSTGALKSPPSRSAASTGQKAGVDKRCTDDGKFADMRRRRRGRQGIFRAAMARIPPNRYSVRRRGRHRRGRKFTPRRAAQLGCGSTWATLAEQRRQWARVIQWWSGAPGPRAPERGALSSLTANSVNAMLGATQAF